MSSPTIWIQHVVPLVSHWKRTNKHAKDIGMKMFAKHKTQLGRNILIRALIDANVEDEILLYFISQWQITNKRGYPILILIEDSHIKYQINYYTKGIQEESQPQDHIHPEAKIQEEQSQKCAEISEEIVEDLSKIETETKGCSNDAGSSKHPTNNARASDMPSTTSKSFGVTVNKAVLAGTKKLTTTKVPDDVGINKDTAQLILQISPKTFEYEPKQSFTIYFEPEWITDEIFDFKNNRFFPQKGWPTIVNWAISKEQNTCSFSAHRGVSYFSSRNPNFCRMEGHCTDPCSIKFEIIFPEAPKKGKATIAHVTTAGTFELVQTKLTGRQCRNLDRAQLKEKLERQNAKAVYLRNFNATTGLHALHRNLAQRSEASLRKMKSEGNVGSRLHKDPSNDILLLRDELIKKYPFSKRIPGFIQHVNTTSGFLKTILFDERAVVLHLDMLKRGNVSCFIDASGQFVQKLKNKENKEPFLYVLLGRTENNISYPIAEMISERGNLIQFFTKSVFWKI